MIIIFPKFNHFFLKSDKLSPGKGTNLYAKF